MTPEEVWREAMGRHNVAFHDERDGCPFTAAEVAAVSVIRTAMEAYAAEKVAEVIRALETQMEDQADDTTPSSIHRQNGKIWLEGWFDFSQAIAANQHHGGNDADT